MMKKKLQLILTGLVTSGLIVGVVPQMVEAGTFDEYVSAYSSQAPIVTITRAENVDWTNKDVQLTVNVSSPSGSKLEYIVQPNGNIVTTTTFNYTITGNGVYTFKAFDENGKVGYNTVYVKSIDRANPEVTLNTPSDWARTDQRIDIIVNNK